jgi:nickel superoxide dismutase
MNKYRAGGALIAAAVLLLAGAAPLFAHCEIPCGIYGDEMRIGLLKEHIATIEKSMQKITELSGETPANYNQLVRWIGNKEEHAEQFQHIVTQYFMTQRLKLAEDGAELDAYTRQLACLHRMLIFAMKCKQTTEPAHVETLKYLIGEFHDLYFGKDDTEHLKKHH